MIERIARMSWPTATKAFWSAADAAAGPAAALVMMVGLVRTLTTSDYGVFVIAMAASSISMAVNPAIAATTTKFVSQACSRPGGSVRSATSVITTSLAIAFAIDVILLVVAVVFRHGLSHLLFGQAEGKGVDLSLILAVLAVAIQQIDAVLAAGIRGLEKFRHQATLEFIARVSLTAVVVIVASASRSVPLILASQSIVYLIAMVARGILLRRLLGGGRLLGMPHLADIGPLLQYGGWMWLTVVTGFAYMSADKVIVGRAFGPSIAGQYNISVQLAQLVHFVPSSLFAFALPVFSRLSASGREQLDNLVRFYWKCSAGIGIVAATMAVLLTGSFPYLLGLLGRPGSAASQPITILMLVANFCALALGVAPYYLLLALGYARFVSIMSTAASLVSLAFMFLLVRDYGMQGVIVGRLVYAVSMLSLWMKAVEVLRRRGMNLAYP